MRSIISIRGVDIFWSGPPQREAVRADLSRGPVALSVERWTDEASGATSLALEDALALYLEFEDAAWPLEIRHLEEP